MTPTQVAIARQARFARAAELLRQPPDPTRDPTLIGSVLVERVGLGWHRWHIIVPDGEWGLREVIRETPDVPIALTCRCSHPWGRQEGPHPRCPSCNGTGYCEPDEAIVVL